MKTSYIITFFCLLLIFIEGAAAVEPEPNFGLTRRFGLFIGANNGGRDRLMLRYAVSDAKAVSKVFTEMGGIAGEDNVILIEPSIGEIERGVKSLYDRVTASKEMYKRTEVVFYYSGHADEEGLILGRERYAYKNLRERINRIPSDMRIVILDSCSSGAFTRAKGGVKTRPFLADNSVSAEGYAFLTSSSATEVSQESDRIESSYFTHSLVAGLRGAADAVGDGRVTLNELYRFAYSETLSRTETSVFGIQHPSYDMQISGSGDVVLTDIKEISASLVIDEQILGRLSIRNSSDYLIAEITKLNLKPMELGLEPGLYRITLQKGDNFYRAEIRLEKDRRVSLVQEDFALFAGEKAVVRGKQEQEETGKEKTPVQVMNVQLIPGQNIFGFRETEATANVFLFGLFGGIGYKLRGVGLAPIGLSNSSDVQGIQVAGMFNLAGGDMSGVQVGGIFNTAGEVRGIQTAGIFNVAGGGVSGVQVGGIFNYAGGNLWGLQTGLINYGAKGGGVQIGLVNISNGETALPIGLVNIVKNGLLHPAVYYDDMGMINFSFRSGSKNFYTLFSVGIQRMTLKMGGRDIVFGDVREDQLLIYRTGIGTEVPLGPAFFDLDITSGTILNLNAPGEKFENFGLLDIQGRLTAGFKFFEHLGVFAGVSYDYIYRPREGSPELQDLVYSWSRGRHMHKIGFFGGIQF
jgi:hypothetical protein